MSSDVLDVAGACCIQREGGGSIIGVVGGSVHQRLLLIEKLLHSGEAYSTGRCTDTEINTCGAVLKFVLHEYFHFLLFSAS